MPSAVFVDTNAIIEAVRTGCWAAITGQLRVETVAACRDEAMAGSPDTIRDYVPVATAELTRLTALHEVSPVVQAAFKLAYGDADSLDAGEHDLLAHAYASGTDDCWMDFRVATAPRAMRTGRRSVATDPRVGGAPPSPALPLTAVLAIVRT